MKIVFAIFLFIHGFAHIITFLVHWKLLKNSNVQYKTTIFPGSFNIGTGGMRIAGLIFLLTGLLFGYLGFELLAGMHLFWSYIWRAAIISLVLCIISWPETKFGVIANGILIAFLMFNDIYHWIQ